MDTTARPGVLPLRPLTVGEILDAAVALLRTRALPLLGVGFVLAALEQALLYPMRSLSHMTPFYVPDDNHVTEWWATVSLGFGFEAMIIALLGAIASAAAVPALVGPERAPAYGGSARRATKIAVIAVVVGALSAAGAAVLLLPWFAVYAFLGLAVPAAVIDRLGAARALGRSMGLNWRSGLRPGMIRILGYLGWLLFRLALGIGGVAVIEFIPGLDTVVDDPLLLPSIAWLLVNTVAYPTLACLDAVLHLEARMRVEGLDLTLGRTLRRGTSIEQAFAVVR